MFSRNKPDTKLTTTKTEKVAAPKKPAAPSIISTDCRIKGDLVSDGEIQIDGLVEGDIRTHSLLVGQGAQVKGEIIAESVRVHGNVTGQIKARHVNLAKSSHVVGDILHEDLSIDTGAFLEGHCKRMEFGSNDLTKGGSGLSVKETVTPKESQVTKPEPAKTNQPSANQPNSGNSNDGIKNPNIAKATPATGTA